MKNFLAVPLLFALLSTPASATIISDTNVQFSFGTVNDPANNNQPNPRLHCAGHPESHYQRAAFLLAPLFPFLKRRRPC